MTNLILWYVESTLNKSQENSSERKWGRPADGEEEDVEIANYLVKYVDHQFTLSEVEEMMKQKLKETDILFLEMVKKKTSKTFWWKNNI